MIIGIDPGITGAVAALAPSGKTALWVVDMPVVVTATTRKRAVREIDAHGLARVLRPYAGEISAVLVERVRAMPRRPERADGDAYNTGAFHGGFADFSMGDAKGVIRGVCAALGLSVEYVEPGRWKRHFGLIKADKDASRCLALQVWPAMSEGLKLKRHHGRAEALLIARFGAMVLRGEFEPRDADVIERELA